MKPFRISNILNAATCDCCDAGMYPQAPLVFTAQGAQVLLLKSHSGSVYTIVL